MGQRKPQATDNDYVYQNREHSIGEWILTVPDYHPTSPPGYARRAGVSYGLRCRSAILTTQGSSNQSYMTRDEAGDVVITTRVLQMLTLEDVVVGG